MQIQAEANLSALIESTEDLIWSVDLDDRLATFNGALQRYIKATFGIQPTLGMLPRELVPPARANLMPPLYKRARAEGSVRVEFPLADGRTLDLTLNTILVDGIVTGVSVFGKDITERMGTENALRMAEAKYRDIFDGALEGMFQTAPKGEPLTVNPALAKMLGYVSPAEFLSVVRNVADDVWADIHERDNYLRQLEEHGAVLGFECQLKRKDGTSITASLNTRRVCGADGQLLFHEGFILDITERKRAADLQREGLDALKEAQLIGALGSYVLDIPRGMWTSSEALDEFFGIGKDYVRDVAGWAALIHPEDQAMMTSYFTGEVLGKRQAFDKEYRIVRQTDGTVHWVHGMGRLEFDAQNQPLKMRGIIKDITDRKQAEQAMAANELRFRTFFEANGSVMLLFEPPCGAIVDANRAASTFYGYSKEQLIGMPMSQINTRPREEIALECQQARREERSFFNLHHRLASGEEREVGVYSSPVEVDGRGVLFSIVHDLTEQKQAERALAAREARFRTFFEENGSVMYMVDPETCEIVDANRAACEFYGYPREQFVGMFTSQINLSSPEVRLRNRQEAMRKDRSCFYYLHRLASGEVRDVELHLSPFEVDGRRLLYAIVNDITERRLVERALAESENLFRAITETSPLGMALVSGTPEQIEYLNPAFIQLFGYTRDDIPTVAEWWQLAYPDPEYRQQVTEDWRIATAYAKETGDTIEPLELMVACKDGSKKIVEWGLVNIGERSLAYGVDITGRKQSEIQLRNSEEHYRSTFEQATVGIIHASFEGIILRSNAHFAEMVGYNADELPGIDVQQITFPEDGPASREALELVLSSGSAVTIEKRYLRKDGSPTWAKLTISIQHDGEGCPLHFTGLVEDINARKAAEDKVDAATEALRASEERYRIAFQTSLDCVNINRLDNGVYVDVNRAFVEIIGYEREEIIGRSSLDLNIWADSRDRQKMAEGLLADSVVRNMEAQFRTKNGTLIWGLMSASLIELDGVRCILSVTRDITEARVAADCLTAAASALRLSEERYRTVFQACPDAVVISRISDGKILDANQAFLDSSGFERSEVLGRTTLELGIWVNECDLQNFVDTMALGDSVQDMEVQSRRKNGEIFWMRLSASEIEIDGEQCRLTFAKEITEVKAAEQNLASAAEALLASEERYRTVFHTSLDCITVSHLSDGRYVDVNKAFLDLIGIEPEEIVGRTSTDLGIWANPETRTEIVEMLRRNPTLRDFQTEFVKKSGEKFWVLISASVIQIGGISCVVSVVRDISGVKAAESTIHSLALYDPLTGLPNRRLLFERLSQTLTDEAQNGRMKALLLIDVDNLKTLNDTLGHHTGDLLLQEVARRIAACAHETDTVGRVGGDEFVVILDGLSEIAEEAATQAKAVGQEMLNSISQPYLLENRECLTAASMGVAVFGDQDVSADNILQHADIALHLAKADGRNTLRFFSPALQAVVNAQAKLEKDLRLAIKTKQFMLYYQPQVERGRLTGAEALIRWKHPSRGIVLPDEFISIAENTRLILPMGDWVLETACKQIAAWAGRPETARLMIAVNISALQFRQPEFVEHVLAALETTGANPKCLKLELTESMLVENFEDVIAKMAELKSHGLSFSLDDFGTGYSSLAYLKRLPLDQLKIDRSFVRDMLVDLTSGAIAQTIISLGRAMELSVVAEGVETEEQRGFLAGLGCHCFQGHLFSPALPPDELEAFL